MIKYLIRNIVTVACVLILFNNVSAQQAIQKTENYMLGIFVGYGSQNTSQHHTGLQNNNYSDVIDFINSNFVSADAVVNRVSYNYQVIFFQIQFFYPLMQNKNLKLDLCFQPQYNITKFTPTNHAINELNGYELGLNIGLILRKDIFNDLLHSYIMISTGPHYVSGTPDRQANGFLFSDNFLIGINISLSPRTFLDIRGGFRHISNAGLKGPNEGINNLIIGAGILFNI